MTAIRLPVLDASGEATRETLHAHARALAAVTHAHGIAHPNWWHVGLAVHPNGFVAHPVPLPGGAALTLRLDVHRTAVVISTSEGMEHRIDISSGMTASAVGDEIIDVVGGLGLEDAFDRSRFEDDSPREFDPEAAMAYFEALTAMAGVFERRRATLGHRAGPLHLWPHGFDLAFEWFGDKTVDHDGSAAPTQINLGFWPGQEPYVYSSPWPFDDRLTERPLPHGAVWNTEGWQGAMLAYEAVRTGDPSVIVDDFARAVFDAAAPGL